MKVLLLLLSLVFLSGCATYYEKHFTLEGEGIKVPYGWSSIKGDKIKMTRDVIIGQKK